MYVFFHQVEVPKECPIFVDSNIQDLKKLLILEVG